MAVIFPIDFDAEASGLFVPFRGVDRSRGPIGTLHVHGDGTGDATGGTMTINFRARQDMFGFRGLYVPRVVGTDDNLASGIPVRLTFASAGNERLIDGVELVDRKKETVASVNINVFPHGDFQLVIEPNQVGVTTVMSFIWGTNTDTKSYHARAFFLVYDVEAISKGALWIPDDGFINS